MDGPKSSGVFNVSSCKKNVQRFETMDEYNLIKWPQKLSKHWVTRYGLVKQRRGETSRREGCRGVNMTSMWTPCSTSWEEDGLFCGSRLAINFIRRLPPPPPAIAALLMGNDDVCRVFSLPTIFWKQTPTAPSVPSFLRAHFIYIHVAQSSVWCHFLLVLHLFSHKHSYITIKKTAAHKTAKIYIWIWSFRSIAL